MNLAAILGKFTAVCVAVMCAFGAMAASLPEGYQAVEYVDSTGTQWFDTGVVVNENHEFRFKYAILSCKEYRGPFGSYVSESANATRIMVNNGSKTGQLINFMTKASGGSTSFANVTTKEGEVVEGWMNYTRAKLNNVEQNLDRSASKIGTADNSTLKLLGRQNYATSIRLYYFQSFENNELKHSYIPCYEVANPTNIRIYDACTGDFLPMSGSGALKKGGDITLCDGLRITGAPDELGTVVPTYGVKRGIASGNSFPCTAPAAWTNEEATVAATCVGYKVYTNDVIYVKGSNNSFTYTHPDCASGATLVWQWAAKRRVSATVGGAGTVAVSGDGWFANGETVTVTAMPAAGSEFHHWEGDVAAEKAHDPELVFTMGDAPVSLRAVFGSSVYVSQPSGGDDYATIQAAIDNVGSWGKVSLARGTWKISKALAVTNDVTLVGETGDPEDVCITTTAKDVAFAKVKGGTVSGLAFHGAWGTQKPALSLLAGGVATNCIVRSCEVTGGGNDACAVTLNGADALMTHCVVSNNVNSAGPGNGMARACGGVHVENGTLAWSLVAGNRETYSAVYQKGGVFLKDGLVLNCTVVNNRGPGCGGIAIEDAFAANGIVSNCVIAANVASLSGTSVNAYQTKSDRYSHYCNCLSDSSAPNATCGQAAAYNIFRDLAHGDYRGNVGFSTLNGQTVGCYPVPDGELVAGFSATAVSGTLPLEVMLTAAFSGAQGPVSYAWDLDGDGIYEDTTSGDAVVCTLRTAGNHSVGLKVSDGAHVAELYRPDFITALPKTLYVKKGNANATFPYDTEEKAAAEIQTAVDAAIDGCTVCLLTDTYTVTAPVTVDKGVTLCGQTGDPDDVVLTCGTKAQSAVKLNHRLARVEGVTVTGATGACAGAIYLNNLGGTASNCVVRGCVFSGGGNDGAAIYATSADSLVTHCVVSNNSISTGCGNSMGRKCAGIVLWSGAKASNCLVANCKYTDSPNDYSPGGIYAKDSYVYNCTVIDCVGTACGGIWSDNSGGVYNSVIAGCNANKKGSGYHSVYSGTSARFHNCAADTEVINATCKKDEANNLFKGYASGNYAPKVGSALIGNGDPAIGILPEKDLAGNARLSDEGAIDIGAYQLKVEFGVGLKSPGTEFLAPCRVRFEAEVAGVPAEDEIVYEWTVGEEVTEENSAVKFVDFATAGDVMVSVRAYDGTQQMWSAPSDPVAVHVVPKTIWVNPGNEHAAQPYASKTTGAADLQTVLDYAVGGCEILIACGIHALTVDTTVEKPVTLRGETDDPADVVFRPQSGILPFVLKADGAVLANVTVEGLTGSGTAIKVDDLGGTVSNCVVRSCCISANRGDYDRTSVLAAIGRLARVTRCVITNNTCTASPPNTNGRRGPGLSLQSGARADNCLIACNSNLAATVNLHLPGGVYIDNGVLVNCTVVDNYGRATGGVWIDNMFGGGVVGSVTNCVMAGNSCKAAANDANFLVAKTDGGATGFIALTAKPVACATDTVKLGDDSVVGTMQGFFRLKRSRPYSLRDKSPLCDAGVDVNLPTDLLGNSRPFNRRYDIGCYESQIGGLILMVR